MAIKITINKKVLLVLFLAMMFFTYGYTSEELEEARALANRQISLIDLPVELFTRVMGPRASEYNALKLTCKSLYHKAGNAQLQIMMQQITETVPQLNTKQVWGDIKTHWDALMVGEQRADFLKSVARTMQHRIAVKTALDILQDSPINLSIIEIFQKTDALYVQNCNCNTLLKSYHLAQSYNPAKAKEKKDYVRQVVAGLFTENMNRFPRNKIIATSMAVPAEDIMNRIQAILHNKDKLFLADMDEYDYAQIIAACLAVPSQEIAERAQLIHNNRDKLFTETIDLWNNRSWIIAAYMGMPVKNIAISTPALSNLFRADMDLEYRRQIIEDSLSVPLNELAAITQAIQHNQGKLFKGDMDNADRCLIISFCMLVSAKQIHALPERWLAKDISVKERVNFLFKCRKLTCAQIAAL